MSTISQSVVRECPNCGHELTLGTLACPECHTLIHGAELNGLAREAKALEAREQFAEARELWNRSLALLPQDSKQSEWVREHLRSLELARAAAPQMRTASTHPWARKLGPLAPIALVLAKSKGLLLAIFKLKFLFSFFSFVALYVALFGWRYGVGIAVCILIHEMGHFIDIKRRGLPAEMPVFLPGLGAYVKWTALGVTRRQVAQIALAGPFAGWIAAAACFIIYTYTHDPLWAALARSGAVLNVLNLIPVWMLDGGKAASSFGLVERVALLAAALGIWLFSWQPIFFLVAVGAIYQLFTRDKPAREDWNSWIYYVALLAALAIVLHLTPEVHGGAFGQ